jgi:Domain of unknown function (DUF5076)/Mannitol repressor
MAEREYGLPKPDAVETGTKAVEVLRAWQVDGVLHISMQDGLVKNPFGCGVFLADTGRIIATATEHHPEKTAAQAYADIRYGFFEAFMPRPQDVPAGFPSLGSHSKIVKLFHAESDRAAAVLAGSFLETYLGNCLQFYLVDHLSVRDLFRGFGPLATFSARIGVAFAVGLLTEEMRSDLKYIKDIRNHFAHHPDETSFDVSPVRDICKNFSLVDALPERTPREHYLFAIGGVAAQLNNAMLVAQRRRQPDRLGA